MSVEFDPPYRDEDGFLCHLAALRAVKLLATDLGDDDPTVTLGS